MSKEIDLIEQYFELTKEQRDQFAQLPALYREWNELINVISRKDIAQIVERHLLHSLAIARLIQFKPGTRALDVGTGGGFPGMPLAILFPQASFHLVDSIGKKITVTEAIAQAIDLKNVNSQQIRAEELKTQYDFVVSRAVTRMKPFLQWVQSKFRAESLNSMPNGVLALKGGDLVQELSEISRKHHIYNISDYFEGEFFETKKIVYVPMTK